MSLALQTLMVKGSLPDLAHTQALAPLLEDLAAKMQRLVDINYKVHWSRYKEVVDAYFMEDVFSFHAADVLDVLGSS